jgi:hypothetical protein
MRHYFLLVLSSVLIAQCNNVTAPLPSGAAANFTIVLVKSDYSQDEASTWGIRATVTNTSKDANFFANVGDGFNSALDQPVIFAAMGTHAIIERQVSGTKWTNANAGALIEGSRFVRLSAGKSYDLEGSIAPKSPGTYRVRLDYFTRDDDPTETPHHAYSTMFSVR